jgi:hypothetical protein
MADGKRAAIAAGYEPATAKTQASQLLNLQKVQDEIARLQVRQLQKTELLVAATVTELARIAFCDPGNLLDEHGRMMRPDQWPEDLRHAVASYKCDKAGNVLEIKFWSKPEALAMMGKYTGILREKDNAAASDAPTRTEVTITLVQAQPRNPDPVAELEPTRATIQQPANYGTAAVEVKLIGAAGQNGPDGTT